MQIRILRDCYWGKAGMVRDFGGGVADALIVRGLAEPYKPKATKRTSPRNKRANTEAVKHGAE